MKIKASDLGPGVTAVSVGGTMLVADEDGMIDVKDKETAQGLIERGKSANDWAERRNRVANTASPVSLTSSPEDVELEMPPAPPDESDDDTPEEMEEGEGESEEEGESAAPPPNEDADGKPAGRRGRKPQE